MERLPPPASTSTAATQPEPSLTPEQRRLIILGFLASIVIAASAATAIYFMVQNPAVTTVIRDIFIIFLGNRIDVHRFCFGGVDGSSGAVDESFAT